MSIMEKKTQMVLGWTLISFCNGLGVWLLVMVGADRRLFRVCVSLFARGDVSCCWLQVRVTSARALQLTLGYGGAESPASWGCDLGVRVAEQGGACPSVLGGPS